MEPVSLFPAGSPAGRFDSRFVTVCLRADSGLRPGASGFRSSRKAPDSPLTALPPALFRARRSSFAGFGSVTK